MKISHKGLILVAVPLVFELAFVGVLWKMLHDAEMRLAEESRARAVVSYMTELSRMIEDGAIALARYSATQDQDYLADYDRVIAKGPVFFSRLKELVKDNPEDLATVRDLEKTVVTAAVLLDRAKDKFRGRENRLERLILVPRLYKVADRAKTGIDEVIEKYKKVELAAPEEQSRSRALIQQVLIAGLAVNIAAALGLAVFFARGITTRLTTLTDNTVRLARGQPLHEELQGADEIARLDKVFHEMAAEKEEMDRLKQEFVQMVSHDLRSPLTAIQGTLTLLADGTYGSLTEKGDLRVKSAAQNTERLIGLINDLLDIEKLEAGQMKLDLRMTAMPGIISESIASVGELAEASEVSLESHVEDCQLSADKDRILQVMVNLLSNAIKFSPRGGTVSVTVRKEAEFAEVRVRDSGPGIAAEHREAIFDRFRQVSEADGKRGKGTGLGLAICKAIVESHGGSIGVESDGTTGSDFWFRLPLPSSGPA